MALYTSWNIFILFSSHYDMLIPALEHSEMMNISQNTYASVHVRYMNKNDNHSLFFRRINHTFSSVIAFTFKA